MYKISYLPLAKRDITEISNYIEQVLQAPLAAFNLIKDIRSSIENLQEFPLSGRIYQPLIELQIQYRRILVKNYIIFYAIKESDKIVEIQRVIYCKQNLDNII